MDKTRQDDAQEAAPFARVFDRLNYCEASATRRRLRPLWDPGRASWRCRLLERKKKTRAFMVGAHTFQDLHALEKDVFDGYPWHVLIISPEQRESDNQ